MKFADKLWQQLIQFIALQEEKSSLNFEYSLIKYSFVYVILIKWIQESYKLKCLNFDT